jgi:polyhydroxybutyrate depolymerase
MSKYVLGAALIASAVTLCATAANSRPHPLLDRIRAARAANHSQVPVNPQSSNAQSISLEVNGVTRTALVQQARVNGGARPLVIVLHGGTRPASDVFERSSWPDIARRDNIVLIAPQGIDNQWNDGRTATMSGKASTADDVAFLSALIDAAVRDYHVDRKAVFVTGASNGGLMTMRFACDRPDQVTAIAAVIATLPESRVAACRSGKPVPALFMAGTADPIMTFDGRPSEIGARRGNNVPMLSMPATIALWRERNGCGIAESATNLPDLDRKDQSTVTRIDYRACSSKSVVLFFRVNGGGHQEPSLRPSNLPAFAARLLGPQNHDIDGPEQVWTFFWR